MTADSNDANCGPRGNADEQPGQTVTSLEAPNTPRQTRQSIECESKQKDYYVSFLVQVKHFFKPAHTRKSRKCESRYATYLHDVYVECVSFAVSLSC